MSTSLSPHRSIHVTGNTVVDELILQRPRAARPELYARFDVEPRSYAVATVHRVVRERRASAAPARDLPGPGRGVPRPRRAGARGAPPSYDLRTTSRLAEQGLEVDPSIRVLPPLGYLDFLGLHASAALTLTDSGGLQEEACCLQVPCVTLRDNTERPESVEVGANVLAGADPERIVAEARRMRERPRNWKNPFGDGRSGPRIVDLMVDAHGDRSVVRSGGETV